MAALSDFSESKYIDHMLRGAAYTVPTTIYLALFTAVTGLESNAPTAEVSGGAYARQAVTLDAASGGASANTSDITFPIATADWGTITHLAIVDHLSNTTWGTNVNVLMWAALDTARAINSGELFKILAGDLSLSLA